MLAHHGLQPVVVEKDPVEAGERHRLRVGDLHDRVIGGRRAVQTPGARGSPADDEPTPQVCQVLGDDEVEGAQFAVVGDFAAVLDHGPEAARSPPSRTNTTQSLGGSAGNTLGFADCRLVYSRISSSVESAWMPGRPLSSCSRTKAWRIAWASAGSMPALRSTGPRVRVMGPWSPRTCRAPS